MACTHLDRIVEAPPSGPGCVECMATGGTWVTLRRCASCGQIGCCDNSPGRHATGHFRASAHPIIQSYEPGEEWYWCYIDETAFELPSDRPSPSHP